MHFFKLTYRKQVSCILLVGIIVGILCGYALPEKFNRDTMNEFSEDTLEQLEDKQSRWDYFEYLFLHNFRVNLAIVLTGVLTNAIPLSIVLFNGSMVGYLGTIVGKEKSFLWVIAVLLPHGIFEFPALILSGIIGIQLTFDARPHFKNRDFGNVVIMISKALWLYMTRVVPLLILAAAIEGGALAAF